MIKTEVNPLSKTCAACGTERKAKALKYDLKTFLPYCANAYACGGPHPEHPDQVVKAGAVPTLVSYEEAEKVYSQHLTETLADPELVKQIRNLSTKPTVFRLGSPDLAMFLVQLKEEQGLSGISEAVRYCIERFKEMYNGHESFKREVKQEQQDAKQLEQFAKEIEQPKQQATQPQATPSNNDKWSF